MDLAEIFRVMRRRWYVLLPGLLLTAALTAGAYLKVPVTYQSQSTVVLLNSQKATVAFDGNPFLSTQLSLNGMADSLARNLNSDASVADLRAQGATGTTVAKIADNALGPLLWLTASGTDKHAVLTSDRLLTAYAAKRLQDFQIQQSVPSRAMIRMSTIVPPQNPVAKTKTRSEYLVLAALMGIALSMVATFYVEARLRTPAPGGSGADGAEGSESSGASVSAGSAPQGGEEAGAGPESRAPDSRAPQGRSAQGDEPDRAAPGGAPVRPAPRWSVSRDGGQDGPVPQAEPETTGTEAHRFV